MGDIQADAESAQHSKGGVKVFTLKIENDSGLYELTHNPQYRVISVQGLTRPANDINASPGSADGAYFNSSRMQPRNIVITLVMAGDIEASRQLLYSIFPVHKPMLVYYQNNRRNVKITGYVETLEGDLFVQQEEIQISIICPNPYWQDVNPASIQLVQTANFLKFPLSINEGEPIPFSEATSSPAAKVTINGDVESGFIFTGTVVSSYAGPMAPLTSLTLTNITTGDTMPINYGMRNGDIITINTLPGQLNVSAFLLEQQQTVNLIQYMLRNAKWIRLAPGDNVLSLRYTTLGYNTTVEASIEAYSLYGGV